MPENNHKHSDKTRRSTSPRGMHFQDFLAEQLKDEEVRAEEVTVERLMEAMQNLSEAARQNGTAEMSLDEINAEIEAVRAERKTRGGRCAAAERIGGEGIS